MAAQKEQPGFFKRNGLLLAFSLLFIISLAGQAFTGYKEHNNFLQERGKPEISFAHYLTSGHFIQATFENWESEFLQMALFVVLTIWLRQKGSSESKPMEGDDDVDREPKPGPGVPWPVNKGGFILLLYKNSLSIALFGLFILSFVIHFYGSLKDYNLQQVLENKSTVSAVNFLSMPKFWFESFQNWQSEFLSVAAIVCLSIYLRQKGSAQSKPVDMPNEENK